MNLVFLNHCYIEFSPHTVLSITQFFYLISNIFPLNLIIDHHIHQKVLALTHLLNTNQNCYSQLQVLISFHHIFQRFIEFLQYRTVLSTYYYKGVNTKVLLKFGITSTKAGCGYRAPLTPQLV